MFKLNSRNIMMYYLSCIKIIRTWLQLLGWRVESFAFMHYLIHLLSFFICHWWGEGMIGLAWECSQDDIKFLYVYQFLCFVWKIARLHVRLSIGIGMRVTPLTRLSSSCSWIGVRKQNQSAFGIWRWFLHPPRDSDKYESPCLVGELLLALFFIFYLIKYWHHSSL